MFIGKGVSKGIGIGYAKILKNDEIKLTNFKVDDKENELYSVDYGYKIRLQICDGCYGSHLYYQSSFLSFLKQGLIVYCPNENKYQIEHIVCGEPLYRDVMLVHEFDALIERK